MSHIIKHSTVLALMAVLTFGSFIPSASAATPADQLSHTLSILESTLKQYLTLLTPAPQVAGVQTIVVSNDQELLNAIRDVTGGETIQLKPGTYSRIYIQEIQYAKIFVGALSAKRAGLLSSPVTITSFDKSNRAVVESIELRTAPKWKFDGLSIRPLPTKIGAALSGDDVVFTNNDITFGDSTGWTKEEWVSKTGNAIAVNGGNGVTVSYNHLKNIGFGITVNHRSPNASVKGNVIESFRGDAMRGLGDGGVYEHNLAFNPIQVDANHSDYFQSWRDYGNKNRPVENVTVRNNTFLWQTEPHEFRANTQGVGLFDGPYKGWKIENNLIAINHWHGITVGGGIDTTVKNNVVVDVNNERPGPSWIKISLTKLQEPSVNSFSTDNIGNSTLTAFPGVTNSGNKNITYAEYGQYFVDHTSGNWNVRPGAIPFTVGASDYKTFFKAGVPIVVPPVPTPAPAPQPTLSFTSSKTSVASGESFTLRWSATGATSCTATNGWTGTKNTSGTETKTINTITTTVTFELSCIGAGGSVKKTLSVALNSAVPVPTPTPIDPPETPAPAPGPKPTPLPSPITTPPGPTPVTPPTVKPTPTPLPRPVVTNSPTPVTSPVSDSDTKQIVVTNNVNVRNTPNGAVLSIQPAGTNGVIVNTMVPVSKGNYQWVYVDFASGPDGYVALPFVKDQSANTKQLLEQINTLLVKIKELQALLKASKK